MTFLFTDVEGSTRRWESDPKAMRAALAVHDGVLRSAIEAHKGWLFKHTGDGVCAAFSVAADAVAAAVDAQRRLGLPVRMGIGTGSAELRGEDYFGPVLNRAARVMAAGHGRQILVAAATAALVSGDGLVDLGERRLRDLSSAEHLYQVYAEGLRAEFPPLRTLDAVPGNLPVQASSFVGRDVAVKELTKLVRVHRLVTLTGVGGVGKTRLAVQVAAELVTEFRDGVWLVELGPVGDPGSVPDAVASVLGVTARAGLTVSEGIAVALSDRRLLIVLDNCEHLLDAAADLVETILARTSTVKVLATSREGLRAQAEHLWVVPSLDAGQGVSSTAVELFVERAQAAVAGFWLDEPDTTAVIEICQRLDGIALAIELAAARMVSMSPVEVRDRLTDRFRLLSGARRGLERHQTLRHAVGWSYDLLNDDERVVLNRCALFADGFDVAAAVHLCSEVGLDEYAVLDVLDSLVRKSLITAVRTGGRTRYGMLETIRQFAEDHLAVTSGIVQLRDRHSQYFGDQAIVHWGIWNGPRQRDALDWVDAEIANLRAGFRWASDQGDLPTAAAIAAHAAMLGFASQRFEPVSWAQEVLPAAISTRLALLPRLYTAASFCMFAGRPEAGVSYAQNAIELESDPRFEPFANGWSRYWEAVANVYAGQVARALEIFAELAATTGPAIIYGRCGQLQMLPLLGRIEEAAAIAEETLAMARAHASPYFVAWALYSYAFAYQRTDPVRALDAFAEALDYTSDHRIRFWEALILRETARVEAIDGDLDRALALYDSAISSFHRSGDVTNLAITLVSLTIVFDRVEHPEVAATLHGAATHISTNILGKRSSLGRLRSTLGDGAFERCSNIGAAMEPAGAVQYARAQIQTARRELGDAPRTPPASDGDG